MTKRSLRHRLGLAILVSAALVGLSTGAYLKGPDKDKDKGKQNEQGQDEQGNGKGHKLQNVNKARIAPGQYVSPTAIEDAVQQPLNPGLPAYPNFIAGMAVRSQLSPDGTTLAVLTAGHNSLVLPNGSTDTANSTQYIFLYNVEGANKAAPQLTKVLKQTNSHVGLAFSPDGNTLYAAGGVDDVVYVYAKSGGSFSPAGTIPLNHTNQVVGLSVRPNAAGLDVSADGA